MRTQYLINRKFQLSLTSHFLLLAAIITSLNFFVIQFFFWKMNNLGKSIGLSSEDVFFKFIQDQEHTMHYFFIALTILATAIICIFGLFISHKIAGPLYKFDRSVRDLKAGNNCGPIKFRRSDYFLELEDLYNHYILPQFNKDKLK